MQKTDNIKEWSDEEVVKEYRNYYESVFVIGCFSTRDVQWLYSLEEELGERGYEISNGQPTITKLEDD